MENMSEIEHICKLTGITLSEYQASREANAHKNDPVPSSFRGLLTLQEAQIARATGVGLQEFLDMKIAHSAKGLSVTWPTVPVAVAPAPIPPPKRFTAPVASFPAVAAPIAPKPLPRGATGNDAPRLQQNATTGTRLVTGQHYVELSSQPREPQPQRTATKSDAKHVRLMTANGIKMFDRETGLPLDSESIGIGTGIGIR